MDVLQAVSLHALRGPIVGALERRGAGEPRADDVAEVAEVRHDFGRGLGLGQDLFVERLGRCRSGIGRLRVFADQPRGEQDDGREHGTESNALHGVLKRE